MICQERTRENIQDIRKYIGQPMYINFSPEAFIFQQADKHLTVEREGVPVARASLWWNKVPDVDEGKIGTVGHFEAIDKEAALYILDFACEVLKNHGCTMCIGPMDGNTWRKYRFVTWSSSELPFFMEPFTPQEYPGYFMDAGFEEYTKYESALDRDLNYIDERVEKTRERLLDSGIVIRHFINSEFFSELNRIYRISVVSFKGNPLYTEIDENSFIKQYEQYMGQIPEQLVLIAEKDGEAIGFVFAMPNLAQAAQGEHIDTFVLKTLAVLPGKQYAGLGNLLLREVRENARKMGFKKGIYALMYQANNSANIARKYNAEKIREYTLYARKI